MTLPTRTQKPTLSRAFALPNFEHPFMFAPGLDQRMVEMAKGETLLPFACGVSNGASCQKPMFNVRPTGIWERQKVGWLRTVRC